LAIAAIVGRKMVGQKIVVRMRDAAKIRRTGWTGFAGRSAEVGEDGLLLNLTLTQSGEIIGDRFFFVEADLAGVGAYESFIEDAAGKLVEVFLFESTQHANADFGGVGDGIESEAALLALLAKFFSEGSQGWLRQAGFACVGNNDRRRRVRTPQRSVASRLPTV